MTLLTAELQPSKRERAMLFTMIPRMTVNADSTTEFIRNRQNGTRLNTAV